MKKHCFTIIALLFLVVGQAQIVNIPDANFKAKLLSANTSNGIASFDTPDENGNFSSNIIDINGDGEIQLSEVSLIKYLNVYNSNISNLDGVNFFTNLQILNCEINQIANLDVSSLLNLKYLNCSMNFMSTLSVGGLTNLVSLDCSANVIENLNIQELINLIFLNCSGNILTELNVSNLINLVNLYCSNNQLQNLIVNTLINLQELNCPNNNIQILDVSNLNSLQRLYCTQNQITNLILNSSSSFDTLWCENNQISSLDLDGLLYLTDLRCLGNQLSNLDINNLSNLIYLDCSYNLLQTLDVSNLNNIRFLYCTDNMLETLNVKNNNIIWNSIDFCNNPNLQYICAGELYVNSFQEIADNSCGYTNCTVDSSCSLSVESNVFDNYLSIYPNPVGDLLSINAKQDTEIYSLSIYNLLGQQVQTITNPNKNVDVSSLKSGNYIVKVTTEKGISSGKFIMK